MGAVSRDPHRQNEPWGRSGLQPFDHGQILALAAIYECRCDVSEKISVLENGRGSGHTQHFAYPFVLGFHPDLVMNDFKEIQKQDLDHCF